MVVGTERGDAVARAASPPVARLAVPTGLSVVPPPPRPVTDAFRRVMDIVGAAILLVVTAPIVAVAAIAVRVTSKGPAFFWQDRYGLGETKFKIVKLRTMVVDQAQVVDLVAIEAMERNGVLAKAEHDPRVTAIGRFLRRTSIDELPQLWNVLRGDMALVGPRPVLPFMLDPYPELRRARCVVRPGLTGIWQVSSRADNTSALSMAAEDLEYIRTRSVTTDVRILVATVPAILRGTGAV